MPYISQDAAEIVKREREIRGWSQAELAARAGITKETVVLFEIARGRLVQNGTIDRLCRVIGNVTAGELRAAIGGRSPVQENSASIGCGCGEHSPAKLGVAYGGMWGPDVLAHYRRRNATIVPIVVSASVLLAVAAGYWWLCRIF